MKKIWAMALAVALAIPLVVLLPRPVQAADVSNWAELISDFESLKPTGGTIKLTQDIVSPADTNYAFAGEAGKTVSIETGNYSLVIDNNSTVSLGENIALIGSGVDISALKATGGSTLTLNGAKITKTMTGKAVEIDGDAALIMTGGEVTADQYAIYIIGEATISDGTITTQGSAGTESAAVNIQYKGGREVVINGNTKIHVNGTANSRGIYTNGSLLLDGSVTITGNTTSDAGILIAGNGKVTMKNGTIKNFGQGIRNYGELTLNGGTIEDNSRGIFTRGDGKFIMNAGTITTVDNNESGVFVFDGGTADIKGGTIFAGGDMSDGISIRGNTGKTTTANITGGTITATGINSNGIYITGFSGGNTVADISGGTISATGEGGDGVHVYGTDGSATANISGGSIEASGNLGRGICIEKTGAAVAAATINGGTITATSTSAGIKSAGELTIRNGTINAIYEAVWIQSTAGPTVIYNGSLTGAGMIPFGKSLYVEGDPDPPVTVYSAVSLNMSPEFQSAAPQNYKELKSFRVTAPAEIKLTEGQTKVENFTVEGQKPDGSALTLQDLLGNSGSIAKANYTVAGNDLTFTPTASGNDTLVINDNLTYSGGASIPVIIAASSGGGGGGGGGPMPPQTKTPAQPERIYGDNRYQTALAIACQYFPDGADTVILSRGDVPTDALPAVPLAHKHGGPLLLTPPNALPADVLEGIKALKAKKVILIGGESAVSGQIEALLKAQGLQVERIFGANRAETAEQIARNLGSSQQAVLISADTTQNFADALSISSWAAYHGVPILYAGQGSTLPEATAATLRMMNVSKTLLIGGSAVLSPELEKLVPGAERYAGNNRFETNAAILNSLQPSPEKVYAATGMDFADALAGAVVAGRSNSWLLLTGPVTGGLSTQQEQLLAKQKGQVQDFQAFGGPQAIADEMLTKIKELLSLTK